MSTRLIGIIIGVLILLGGVVLLMRSSNQPQAPQPHADVTTDDTEGERATPQPSPTATEKRVFARDISGVANAFQFSVTIPSSWQVEAVPAIDAINIYDPDAPGESRIEQSQIFVRHFSANGFLTLQTVTIHNRQSLTINGRPATRYDIEKNTGVASFPNQPSWRNKRHIVTDIRVSDANPSVFYVIAQRPNLDDDTYNTFLENLDVVTPPSSSHNASLTEPIVEFRQRITKKPFGIHITPETSPVQPERFSGFHTGVDVEYEDREEDIPVRAIAAGTVVLARSADGYGGVTMIQHTIENIPILVVYGHLDPASLPTVGQTVTAGEIIGILGDGGTAETDGQRKHLHFALLKNNENDLRGYVSQQEDLANWYDPVGFYAG